MWVAPRHVYDDCGAFHYSPKLPQFESICKLRVGSSPRLKSRCKFVQMYWRDVMMMTTFTVLLCGQQHWISSKNIFQSSFFMKMRTVISINIPEIYFCNICVKGAWLFLFFGCTATSTPSTCCGPVSSSGSLCSPEVVCNCFAVASIFKKKKLF